VSQLYHRVPGSAIHLFSGPVAFWLVLPILRIQVGDEDSQQTLGLKNHRVPVGAGSGPGQAVTRNVMVLRGTYSLEAAGRHSPCAGSQELTGRVPALAPADAGRLLGKSLWQLPRRGRPPPHITVRSRLSLLLPGK
jgi:hypothetical protein